MRTLSLAALAAAFVVSTSHAQTSAVKDTAKYCDPQSALLNSPTAFGVQRATVVKACWNFQQGAANFLAANLVSLRKLTGEQAIQWMLYGPAVIPAPPRDTVVTPPPVPVDTTPKSPVDT